MPATERLYFRQGEVFHIVEGAISYVYTYCGIQFKYGDEREVPLNNPPQNLCKVCAEAAKIAQG